MSKLLSKFINDVKSGVMAVSLHLACVQLTLFENVLDYAIMSSVLRHCETNKVSMNASRSSTCKINFLTLITFRGGSRSIIQLLYVQNYFFCGEKELFSLFKFFLQFDFELIPCNRYVSYLGTAVNA